jgi:hypothetical protein
MASGLTNRGKKKLLEMAFRNTYDTAAMDASTGPQFYIALSTVSATLTAATTTFDTGTEIVDTSGYTGGGVGISRSAVGFDVIADTATGARGEIQLADVQWTGGASGMPASGAGAYYAILTDHNDNDTSPAGVGSRDVLAWFDMTSARTIGSGATLTLQDIEIRLT